MSAHAWYVTAAYGLSALFLIVTVAWLLLDQRQRRRDLAELESRGIRRRSEKGKA